MSQGSHVIPFAQFSGAKSALKSLFLSILGKFSPFFVVVFSEACKYVVQHARIAHAQSSGTHLGVLPIVKGTKAAK